MVLGEIAMFLLGGVGMGGSGGSGGVRKLGKWVVVGWMVFVGFY